MGVKQAPSQPAPRDNADPGGPVEPLDVPDLGDIPLGEGNIRIRDGEAVLTTDIDGVPVDIRLGDNGLDVNSQTAEEARRAAEQRRREIERRVQEEVDQRSRQFEPSG